MCGICGVLDLNGRRFSEQHLKVMSNVLRHRGPDDEGSLALGPMTLGFRRLSIVDVAGGHQPMSNEDGTVWIVFNGEIYNDLELRPILESRGHRYASKSDTETIVHLYEEYGEDCVHHLRGMFAFAIWDARRSKLFCARDRLGIKPFYYTTAEGRFAFASEIKAILELPNFQPELNHGVLPEFFAFGYVSSEETLFSGIRKLMPGHRLVITLDENSSQPRITQYWDLDVSTPEHSFSEKEYVAQFRELFTESVRTHLRSDVPLGVFLSGGIDSSAIAATMTELRREPIQTFSVGYAEDQYSELSEARQLARHIRSEHHEVILGAEDFFASLPQLIWHEDEPIVWPSSVALFHVSRLASERVKVVLSGEGGDELLGGYLKYRVTLWNLHWGPRYRKVVPRVFQNLMQFALNSSCMPDGLQRKLRHSFLYHPDTFEKIYFDNFYSVFPEDQQPQLFTTELMEEVGDRSAYLNSMRFFPTTDGNSNLLNRLLYLDMKTYLVELLMKQDQMSMAASIESRVPFLDHKLVEFAARVPARFKIRGFSGKRLLRRAMEKRLPSEVLRRNKKGFPTPIRPWLRNQLFQKLSAILTSGRMAERRLINPVYVRSLLDAHRRGDSQATEGCWRLVNFELWHQIFLDRDSRWRNSPAQWDHALVSA